MIETLFLPPEDEEQIVAALLDELSEVSDTENDELDEIEVEHPNNTNSEDKARKGRRRKSFLDGMGEKTLHRRFGELDTLVEAGKGLFFLLFIAVTIFLFFSRDRFRS